jgi:hypothetical protein
LEKGKAKERKKHVLCAERKKYYYEKAIIKIL